jgi:hypothetical protein
MSEKDNPLSPRWFPAAIENGPFSTAYVSNRCGALFELSGAVEMKVLGIYNFIYRKANCCTAASPEQPKKALSGDARSKLRFMRPKRPLAASG